MLKKKFYTLFLLLCSASPMLWAQETVVSGKVLDARTGEAIPFANVFFKGTTTGTNTDFDGNFRLKTSSPVDSIGVSYIGYITRLKAVKRGVQQTINFQLEENSVQLKEVIVTPGENPALKIIKRVQQNKSRNNPDQLQAYECESFNRVELAVDNISDKIKNKKLFKPLKDMMDSVIRMSGEDGKPVLPVFVSEAISDFYFVNNPRQNKEYIKATKITGVGIEDGSLVSQLLGSTFQQYNFYENWNRILEKDFVSPIAASGNLYYVYTLKDTLRIDGRWCFEIQVNPKRKEDLAFTGNIWIDTLDYALKRVVLEVGKGANLNFIEKLKIQQEMQPSGVGPWVPNKARILVDVEQLTDYSAGMIAKFYTSNKNYVFNKERPKKFYEQKIEVAEDAQMQSQEYWEISRHDSLTAEEKYVYSMVDSVKKVPALKTLADIADIAVNGFYAIGKFDLGPYIYMLGYNRVEGYRFRFGGRTNAKFSRKYVFKGYVAYGERDERFKYNVQAEYILSRKPWTKLVAYRKLDLQPMGLVDKPEAGADNLFTTVSTFTAIKRFGWMEDNRVWVERALNKHFSGLFMFQNTAFSPKGAFAFSYYDGPGAPALADTRTRYTLNYATIEGRFAYSETFLQNDNERISMGPARGPVITVGYAYGPRALFGGDFDYNKLYLDVEHYMTLGMFGNARYLLRAANYFSALPYPSLEIHRGNQSVIYNNQTFNLMNFFEFVSDHYVSLTYEHYFEGLMTNRIPLIRKLKIRTFANTRLLMGGIRKRNLDLLPKAVIDDPQNSSFYRLNSTPYWEIGYGVENILRFIRVDFAHRLNYLSHPGTRSFGVKVSFQFKL